MKWDSVDLVKKSIQFTPMKTPGKSIMIPLHPSLEKHLLTISETRVAEGHLFPSLAGRKTGGAHGLSRRFGEIMEKAQIDPSVSQPRSEGGRAISFLSFHSLRHSFNSAMANRGVSQEVRQRLTGHSSPEMNKVYTRHELETLRQAVDTLPSVPVN